MAVSELPRWLAAARRDGSFQTVTALRRADGSPFAAAVTLTSLADGYSATAQPLPEMAADQALPQGLAPQVKAWMTIARVPFLTATVAPVAFAGAWTFATGLARPFPFLTFAGALLAAALLHTSANLLNDYFDWKSGADPNNNDHFAPFSGGSRSIELGLLTPKGSLVAGLAALATATLLGLGLSLHRGWGLLAFGAVVVVGPLAEEIIFRGLIHRVFSRTWGPWPAIIASALVFGLVHGEPWYLLGLVGMRRRNKA